MQNTHTNQNKQATLSDALSKSKEQKKGAPLIDMLSNSDKLMAQKNLPTEVKSEMEQKFNANLDHVHLYESKLVEDTGANAYAGGASIAFAPGKLDFASFEGKKLLGHELSHIVNKTDELEADKAGHNIAMGENAFSPTYSFDTMSSVITPMSNSDGLADFSGPVAATKSSGKEMMNQFNNAESMQDKVTLYTQLVEAKNKNLLDRHERKQLESMRKELSGFTSTTHKDNPAQDENSPNYILNSRLKDLYEYGSVKTDKSQASNPSLYNPQSAFMSFDTIENAKALRDAHLSIGTKTTWGEDKSKGELGDIDRRRTVGADNTAFLSNHKNTTLYSTVSQSRLSKMTSFLSKFKRKK